MNFKVLALGAALGFAMALTPSCGTTKCSAANCGGCCSSDGTCVKTPNNAGNSSCGTTGNACIDCAKTNQVCNPATYQCGVAGTNGGTDGGSATCGGCLTSNGLCFEITSHTNCGANGSTCMACGIGQECVSGVCTSGDAGSTAAGAVGGACTLDSQCTAVPKTLTSPPYCKTTTDTGSATYKDGYCSRRCTANTDCGTTSGVQNLCIYYLGPNGEPDNFCLQGCGTVSTTCRDGYACYNFGDTMKPAGGCWLVDSVGKPPPVYDAGPGAVGNAGGACTTTAQCGSANNFFCIAAALPDGGPSGYPGGQCVGDCSLRLDPAWCGDGGACLPYLGPSDTRGQRIVWECSQGCNPAATAPNTCRPGYVCDVYNTTAGTCVPDCRNNFAGWCGTNSTCDATTGRCK